MPILIGMLVALLVVNTAQGQDNYADSLAEAMAAPYEKYQDEDEFSNAGDELPPEFRQVSDSTVSRLKGEEDFEYANDEEYWKKPAKQTSSKRSSSRSGSGSGTTSQGDSWQGFYNFMGNPAVKVIFYMLLIAFFVWVIWRIIVVNNLYFYRKGRKAIEDDGPAEEEINDENIDDKIRKAINARDYRNAVRFLYLKGLRLLNDKGWIRYHAQATNHDYVYQVSQYPVAGDFRFLTRIYDYVWYGEFAVNDEQFARLQTNFQQFYQDLKK